MNTDTRVPIKSLVGEVNTDTHRKKPFPNNGGLFSLRNGVGCYKPNAHTRPLRPYRSNQNPVRDVI